MIPVSLIARRSVSLLVLLSVAALAAQVHAELPASVPGVFTGEPGSANVSQGVASATIPIPVPPGRGGVQPSLALHYAAGGLGEAGQGWRLGMPAIERHNISGPPRYADPAPGQRMNVTGTEPKFTCTKTTTDGSDTGSGSPKPGSTVCMDGEYTPGIPAMDRMTFGGELLVPICSLGVAGDCPNNETYPSWAKTRGGGWHYFRLQHDTFSKFFWHPQGRTWRVIDKDGNTYEYGDPLVATGVAANGIDADVGNKPFRWLLTRHYDALRTGTGLPVNVTAYRWTSVNQRSLLTEVFYSPPVSAGGGANPTDDESKYAHHVVLTWEDLVAGVTATRPYNSVPSPAPVWRAQPSMRIKAIDVSSMPVGGSTRELVRRVALSYTFKGIAPRPYLSAAQTFGRCNGAVESNGRITLDVHNTQGCPSLPATTFGYSASGGVPATPAWQYEYFDSFMTGVTPIDVNSDGVADLVSSEHGSDPQKVFLGSPVTGQKLREESFVPRAFGKYVLNPFLSTNIVDGWSPFGAASAFVSNVPLACDPSADGACLALWKDPILTVERSVVGGVPQWSWRQIGNYDHSILGLFPKFSQLGDIDGDGLLDRRYLWTPANSAGCTATVGFADRTLQGALPLRGRSACVNRPENNTVDNLPRILRRSLLADMNADGLPDLVMLWGKPTQDPNEGYAKRAGITYSLGDGSGNFGAEHSIRVEYLPIDPKPSTPKVWQNIPAWDDYLDDPTHMSIADLNGDGYADIIVHRLKQGACTTGQCPASDPNDGPSRDYAVWMNMGGGYFQNEIAIGKPPGNLTKDSQFSLFADFNGNGTVDLAVIPTQQGVLNPQNPVVEYIDFMEGQPEGLLVDVQNGFGATTHFDYESSSVLDMQATTPWTSHLPNVTYLVTGQTNSTSGPAGHTRVTKFEYQDPAWDGWRHSLQGFSSIKTTLVGDQSNDSSSYVTTKYHFSGCHRLPRPADASCQNDFQLEEDSDDTQEGWPTGSMTHDAAGNVLSTTTWHFAPITKHAGLASLTSRFSYVDSVTTVLGEVGSGSELRDVVVREAVAGACDPTRVCPPDVPEEKVRLSFPGALNRVTIRQRTTIDALTGNVTETDDDGRIGLDGNKPDDPIVTKTDWVQVSPETNWLYRPKTQTVAAFAARPGIPAAFDRVQTLTHDTFGQLTDVHATLSGSLPLTRFHEDASSAIAPSPSTAATDGDIYVVHTEYDGFGNANRVSSPASGECSEFDFDSTYKDYGTAARIFGSPGCTGATISSSIAKYDRGFAVPTLTIDAALAQSTIELDAFGRVAKVGLPDADLGIPTDALTNEYFQDAARGVTFVKSSFKLDGTSEEVRWTYFDAVGEPILVLAQGDEADSWIANGLPALSAKGNVIATYDAWTYKGDGNAHPLLRDSTAAATSLTRDAFSRVTAAKGANGKTSKMTFHPLSEEFQDAEMLAGGVHGKGGRQTYRDGHGRTERVVARGNTVSNGAQVSDELETLFAYQATGEAVRIEQGHFNNKSEKIVRWMQYDSLGHLVLNAEPNTSKDFTANASDAAAVAKMRAWRYAYDARGRLVGTSDARGCGKNIAYTTRGDLLAIDYSPCLKTHDPYTAPALDSFGKPSGYGTELFNTYDATGQLDTTRDLGAFTQVARDLRHNPKQILRRIAKPQGLAASDLAKRYATHTFVRTANYDNAGRLIRQSSGADVDGLLVRDASGNLSSDLLPRYGRRGNVKRFDSSYGTLMHDAALDASGFLKSAVYGSVADDGDAVETTADLTPDELHRVKHVSLTHKNAPSSWQTSAPPNSTRQLTLVAQLFGRDDAGNVTSITDERDSQLWASGAKPVTRVMAYDDFYRLTKVDYSFKTLTSDAQSPAAPGAIPRSSLPNRVSTQSFEYGWQGNTTRSTADTSATEDASFYERSLSFIKNGDANGGHPNQLSTAGPAFTNASSSSGLIASYDAGGNLSMLLVSRASCADVSGLCSHLFMYDWNEVGELARARRWDKVSSRDFDGGAYLSTSPNIDLHYAYSEGRRVRKTATVAGEDRHSIDVFPSLRLTHAQWISAPTGGGSESFTATPLARTSAVTVAKPASTVSPCGIKACPPPTPVPSTDGDYETTDLTEHVYLAGIAHVTVFDRDVTGDRSGRRHVLLTLGDELGSTSVVVDKKSGELVERATYQAYGATDSDATSDRWNNFREDHRFNGKEEDVEVGLLYYGARYYNPNIERWISADPLTVHAAGADLNPYAYVHGSPTNFIDPTGLDDCPPGKTCPATPKDPKDPRDPKNKDDPWFPGTEVTPTPDNGTGSTPPGPGTRGRDSRPAPAPAVRASTWTAPSEAGTGNAHQATRPWNPGNEPVGAYIGNDIHKIIAQEYRDVNFGDTIFTNSTPISVIARVLNSGVVVPPEIEARRPDILNAGDEPDAQITSFVYEIRPMKSLASAEVDALKYIEQLGLAGVKATLGPAGAPGTSGAAEAPGGGLFVWSSPLPGVIGYRYFREQKQQEEVRATLPWIILTPANRKQLANNGAAAGGGVAVGFFAVLGYLFASSN